MYDDDDRFSFSLVSTASIDGVCTPTEQDTDEFELIDNDNHTGTLHSDGSSTGSTSLTPSVCTHEFQHGRRYHSYMSGRYPLPNDVVEQQREETMHALMLELTDGKLFLSEVEEYPENIIDVGTGTGTWAVDVADLYPDTTVVGIDLSPIQPKWLPINLHMFVEDCEEREWIDDSGYDLVHFRGVADFLRDLDAVLATAYTQMNHGGWIEFQELDHSILCDDSTMKDDDPLRVFSELYVRGMQQYGCTGFGKQDLKSALERAGFRRVQIVTKKVPISTWPRSKKMQTVGMLMKANIVESFGAFAAKPLDSLGIPLEERKLLASRARKSLDDNRIHRYVNCCFFYGQKAEVTSDTESYLS